MSTERKPLIIAEKPSVARAIAEALGKHTKREGYLEAGNYRITWAFGHLVTLADPDEYNPSYKRWRLPDLPIMPETWRLKPSDGSASKQLKVIAALARDAEYLVNACDSAREGELIFRYITEFLKLDRKPVRRLWVSSLTPVTIQKALTEMRPGDAYESLFASALARSRGDWLVGMNATRAFTARFGDLFSIGRVQTPTLALLVRREREIAAFRPETYWEVWATFRAGRATYRGRWMGPRTRLLPAAQGEHPERLKSRAAAEELVARCAGQNGRVEKVETKPVTERPPQLYDLTTLQREANRRFGLTAAATLKAAQSLYEEKLITYPRTDSRYLTRDLVPGLPRALRALQARYPDLVAAADPGRLHPGNRRVVDDSKVSDHHAIIPTAEAAGTLSGAEAKLYDLIARRFLSQFFPDARLEETTVVTEVVGEGFLSRGKRVVEPGWHAVESPNPGSAKPAAGAGAEGEVETGPLPSLTTGQEVLAKAVEALEKETQPPKRYSEASLLAAMETAGRNFDNQELKEAMKGRGLGTPATRSSIIERLKQVEYISVEKKTLVPTRKGHELVQLAETVGSEVLLSAELTGDWERRIAEIQVGKDDPAAFMAAIAALTAQVVQQVKSLPDGQVPAVVAAGEESGAAKGAAKTRSARGAGKVAVGEMVGRCRRCGGPVEKITRGYACREGGTGCGMTISGFICGHVMGTADITALLSRGRTDLISDFKSKTGAPFAATLVLGEDGSLTFEFPRTGGGKWKAQAGGRTNGRRKSKAQPSTR